MNSMLSLSRAGDYQYDRSIYLHIPPDGDAGFAFFRGAFFAVVFEFSVAADGDDGVFFQDGLGITADPAVDRDLLVFKEILGIGTGQVIYLCEDGIESGRCDRDGLLFQLREIVFRNLLNNMTADSSMLHTIEISAEDIRQFVENEAIRGIVLNQDIADHVPFDPEV